MEIRYIGPFFYINGKLIVLKIDVNKGEVTGDFINHPKSHFEFFLGVNSNPYDDYGHYPRGRVIYNKAKDIFLIYIDKIIIDNKVVIEEIKKEYNLYSSNVKIKRDSHYTHDYL